MSDPDTSQKPGIGWMFVLMELRAGGQPSKRLIDYAIAWGGYRPPEVDSFLSKLAAGEIKPAKGRPRMTQFEREAIGTHVRNVLERVHEEFVEARANGEHFLGSPLDAAMERTSEILFEETQDDDEPMKYSVETIRDIHLRRKGW